MHNQTLPGTVAVVGAGIVGLSVAVQLQRDGHEVVVIDRDDPMQACSAGNAGYLSEANIFPPASPDMLRQLPRLLLSKDGPLIIRPSYLPRMLGWTRRALPVLQPAAHRVVTDTLARMTAVAYPSLKELADHAGASRFLSRDGGLVAFKTASALEKKARALPVWNDYGLVARQLSAAEIRAMEPSLAPDTVGGIFFENSGRCSDPQGLGLQYATHFHDRGGKVVRAEVTAVEAAHDSVTLSTTAGELSARRAVLCAGYWSGRLIEALGYRAPVVSERGYHLMLPEPGIRLTRPVVFGEPHFAATPMDRGLRLAGTAEFARPDSPPDMRRARMLLGLAQRYLVNIDGRDAKPWMGIRPSLPDGLPAIGVCDRHPGLLYAFGHAHNGLTLSAVTARCISALLRGEPTPVDIAPLDIARFGRPARWARASTRQLPATPPTEQRP